MVSMRNGDGTKYLAHFSTLGVADQAVAVDFCKRHLARQLHRKHDHPGHPEEQDIPAGLQQTRWVQPCEVNILRVWPAKDGHRPEASADPSATLLALTTRQAEHTQGSRGLSLVGTFDPGIFSRPLRRLRLAISPPPSALPLRQRRHRTGPGKRGFDVPTRVDATDTSLGFRSSSARKTSPRLVEQF